MFTIQETEGLKRQWKLPEGGTLNIGRAYDNDIRVDDLRVSRHHAVIRSIANNQAVISNVSSGNLLLINGQNVSNQEGERALSSGDEIKLIPAIFTVAWEEENVLGYTDEPLSVSTVIAPATSGFTSLINTTFTGRLSKEKELEELKRKAEMLAHLCDMSAALATVFDPKSILDYATDIVMRMIQVDCCAALLVEQNEDQQPVSIRFRDEITEPAPQRSISRTAVRTAIEKRVMLSSQDVLGDADLQVSRVTIMQGIRSLACAPLAGREFEKAIPLYLRSIGINRTYAIAHLNLGMAYAELGKFEESIASLIEAVRLKPDFAVAQHNLGYVLVKAGRVDEAVRAYKQAILLKPDFARAYHNLAVAYLDQGKRSLALEQYDRLKSVDKVSAEHLLDVINQDRAVVVRKQ